MSNLLECGHNSFPFDIVGDYIGFGTRISASYLINKFSEQEIERIEIPLQIQQAQSSKRREEFQAGRIIAYLCLKALSKNKEDLEIKNLILKNRVLPNKQCIPDWPENYFGSITHTRGYLAAVVLRKQKINSIGIDSEKNFSPRTSKSIRKFVCTPNELKQCEIQGDFSESEALSLIFSAKESIFKAIYPLTHVYFGFLSARIFNLDNRFGRFSFELLVDLSDRFKKNYVGEGKFYFEQNFVHTLVEIY